MALNPRKPWYLISATAAAVALALGTAAAVQASPAAPAAASLTVACAAGTNVTTASGPVCGITDNGVNEWLGMPYAAPPVGSLRWQPPQPPVPWTATLAATAFGDECIQPSPDQG